MIAMEEEVLRVRMPVENEVFGVVETKLGGNKVQVRCQDGNTRICRIPGKMKSKMWIKVGDVVLIKPWPIKGEERGDVVWQYSKAQVEYLREKGILKL